MPSRRWSTSGTSSRAPFWATAVAIVVLALLAAALTAIRSPWLGALAVLAVLAAYLTVAAVVFDAGVVLNLIYPPGALLAGFGVTLAHRVVFAEEDRRLAREAMDRYLSPAVGRWVLADPAAAVARRRAARDDGAVHGPPAVHDPVAQPAARDPGRRSSTAIAPS